MGISLPSSLLYASLVSVDGASSASECLVPCPGSALVSFHTSEWIMLSDYELMFIINESLSFIIPLPINNGSLVILYIYHLFFLFNFYSTLHLNLVSPSVLRETIKLDF